MLAQLVLRDQLNGRCPKQALVLDWQDNVPLTARTLISERVRIEWDAREAEFQDDARKALAPLVSFDMMRRLGGSCL